MATNLPSKRRLGMGEEEIEVRTEAQGLSGLKAEPGLPVPVRTGYPAGPGSTRESLMKWLMTPENPHIGRLWLGTAEVLRLKVPQCHLRQGLLAVMAMVSAHLGDAFNLVITTEPGVDALRLLNLARSLLPEELAVEISSIDRKVLSKNPSVLQGKVVIAHDLTAHRAGKEIVRLALGQSPAGRPPTSLVALIDQAEPEWLKPIPALRVNLDASPEFVKEEMERRTQGAQDPIEGIKGKIIAKEFKRLRPRAVLIPYLGQIQDSLSKADPLAVRKLDLIEELLKVITIINHATYARVKDFSLEFYKLELPITPDGPDELVASKVEYNIFYKLAAPLFTREDNELTDRQVRIFEAIKQINLELFSGGELFIDPKASEREILDTLDRQDGLKGWATHLEIYNAVNKDGGGRVSFPIVDEETHALQRQGLISGKIDPAKKERFKVETLALGHQTGLPHPSDIKDPIYGGESITVPDLLTGSLETI
jgi:hypothetical protein